MTDSPTTQETTAATTEAVQAATAPVAQQVAHAAQQPSTPSPQAHTPSAGPGPGQQILDALNGLPERIVNALREATASTAPVTPEGKTTPTTPSKSAPAKTQPAEDKAPGRKTFAQWWFN